MPLTVAMHCAKLTNPQFVLPPKPSPLYSAQQGEFCAYAGVPSAALTVITASADSNNFINIASLFESTLNRLPFSDYISIGRDSTLHPIKWRLTHRTISNTRWIVTHILREALIVRTQICLAAATE
jgi:hypothetical protein